VKRQVAFAAWLLAACATQPEPASGIEPLLGHHQPLPTQSASAVEPAPERQEQRPLPSSDTDADAEPSDPPSEQVTADSPMLPTAEEQALCQHIVKLVQSESREQASAEQTDELILNCGLALAHDRRRMGTEEFERRAECMFAAKTVADFAACAPESASNESP
jgi:hypothetical protein